MHGIPVKVRGQFCGVSFCQTEVIRFAWQFFFNLLSPLATHPPPFYLFGIGSHYGV